MNQRTLFTEPLTAHETAARIRLAAKADPQTSHEAASKLIDSGAHSSQCQQVLDALRKWPGLTSRELSVRADIDRHLCGKRLPDLERAGLVRRTGVRKCQCGNTNATVWEPTK